MKKILFYTDSGYFSGAEIYFCQVVSYALKAGHEVEVIVSSIFESAKNEYWDEVRNDPKANISYRATGNKLDLGYARRLRRHMRETRPELVVVNMWTPYSNTWALVTASGLGIPVIGMEHFYQERADIKGILRPLKLLAYKLKNRWLTKSIVVSQAHRKVLTEEFGADPAKIELIRPGREPRAAPTLRSESPIKFVFCGTIEPRKQPIFLLSVFAQIDLPWHLTLLGGGEQEEEARAFVKAHELMGKVVLAGRVSNPRDFMEQSDVLVHPALSENFSAVIIEGLATGLPILANDVGGNPEMVIDGKTGRLLPVGDETAWRSAITEIIENREERRQMGHAARQFFLDHLTTEVMRTAYVELFARPSEQI